MIKIIFGELKQHKVEYLVLVIGLVVMSALYVISWPDVMLLRLIAIGLGIFYSTWGIFAHTKSKTVSFAVGFEYLAISFLAVIILLLITW